MVAICAKHNKYGNAPSRSSLFFLLFIKFIASTACKLRQIGTLFVSFTVFMMHEPTPRCVCIDLLPKQPGEARFVYHFYYGGSPSGAFKPRVSTPRKSMGPTFEMHVTPRPYEEMDHPIFQDPRHIGVGGKGYRSSKFGPVPYNFGDCFLGDLADITSTCAGLDQQDGESLKRRLLRKIQESRDQALEYHRGLSRIRRKFPMSIINKGHEPVALMLMPFCITRHSVVQFWEMWREWAYLGVSTARTPLRPQLPMVSIAIQFTVPSAQLILASNEDTPFMITDQNGRPSSHAFRSFEKWLQMAPYHLLPAWKEKTSGVAWMDEERGMGVVSEILGRQGIWRGRGFLIGLIYIALFCIAICKYY